MERINIVPSQIEAKIKKLNYQSSFPRKILYLGMINLVGLMILIIILTNLSSKAVANKKLKSLAIKASQTNLETVQTEVAATKEKNDKLIAIFPDEDGLINFIKEIDGLKKDKQLVQFSFATDNLVKDKTGYLGLPLVFEFKGNSNQINSALTTLDKLPFFLRPINIDIRHTSAEEISLKYGGILYVSQKYSQD